MGQVEQIPIAEAALEWGQYSWVWVVLRCPHCGKAHEHYAGPLDNDPYKYLGQPVISKCNKTDRREMAPNALAMLLQYVLHANAPS